MAGPEGGKFLASHSPATDVKGGRGAEYEDSCRHGAAIVSTTNIVVLPEPPCKVGIIVLFYSSDGESGPGSMVVCHWCRLVLSFLRAIVMGQNRILSRTVERVIHIHYSAPFAGNLPGG